MKRNHGLRRELKLRDLVMIQVILIVSLTWPAYAAQQGSNQLLLWLLAIGLFYMPLAAVVMKLSREIPLEGGAYQWVKAGLTPWAGFMAGWSVTIAVVALYAALGSTLADAAADVAGPHGEWMAASNPFALGLTAAVCLLTYWINVRGLHLAKWFSTGGSIMLLVTFAAMLYLLVRALLAGKVEDMLNTVVRQIAFHEFERQVHDARKNGELSADQLAEIWMSVARESLGPAFHYRDEYRIFWSYISHFLHSPFYVYAYAFGDCLVNALYNVYATNAVPDFETRYQEMLAAGGRLRHKDLLAPFGLDATDPGFWRRGMKTLSGFIDQLERVA